MSGPTLASLVRSYTALDQHDLLNTEIPSQIAQGKPTRSLKDQVHLLCSGPGRMS